MAKKAIKAKEVIEVSAQEFLTDDQLTAQLETEGQVQEMSDGGLAVWDGVATAAALFSGDQSKKIWSNINRLTPEGKALIVNSLGQSDYNLKDYCNEDMKRVVNMVAMVAHDVVITDEKTSEKSPCTRCVIIDDKGLSYSAVSQGVVSSLQNIMAAYGPGPYNPPIKIVAREFKTRNGYRSVSLKIKL